MKYIGLDEELERALSQVCDAALRNSGIQVFHLVKMLSDAIQEKEHKDE